LWQVRRLHVRVGDVAGNRGVQRLSSADVRSNGAAIIILVDITIHMRLFVRIFRNARRISSLREF
jgi:hypothetical protein